MRGGQLVWGEGDMVAVMVAVMAVMAVMVMAVRRHGLTKL